MIIYYNKIKIFITVLIILVLCAVIQFAPIITNAIEEKNDKIEIPIIMYHQITKIESRKGPYTVTLKQFREDMNYIKSKGYETVTVTQLIDYINYCGELPDKPIIITLDDGFESVYKYVYPIMKEMKMCAVSSIVGAYTDFFTENPDHNVTYSYLNWDTVKTLIKSKEIEIQNHSYDMHKYSCGRKGLCKIRNEDNDKYYSIVGSDVEKMQNKIYSETNYLPNTLTLPYGSYSKETIELAKRLGFRALMLCEERLNILKRGDAEALYHLGRYNRSASYNTETFFNKILK